MSGNIKKPFEYGRAWIEIDLNALAENVSVLRSVMPRRCELMAVVKVDAYGHGAPQIAARVQREGVGAFAVATVGEGIQLRESGIDGEILIMGYTHPKDAGLLNTFSLSQLVIDGAYARALGDAGQSINVHIAVDTGMHRLGIEYSNLTEIESVYACENLTVAGVGTHLASSDRLEQKDVEFADLQIGRFNEVVEALKNKGFDVGKLHVQASYGMLNYPDIRCNYARAGIAMYGVMSNYEDTVLRPALQPVLSLRALVAQVRWIEAGESISYGRTFIAEKPLRLATVCIGYGDGIPRQMSGKGGMCLINGHRVPIIGRVCMDMIMADVSGVNTIAPGDVATLIGKDRGQEIRCEDVAAASGTITNDILCRLGVRLPRYYIG